MMSIFLDSVIGFGVDLGGDVDDENVLFPTSTTIDDDSSNLFIDDHLLMMRLVLMKNILCLITITF